MNAEFQIIVKAQTVKRLPAMRETQLRSLGQEDPLEKEMASHGWSLVGYNPWGHKESDTTEQLHFFTSEIKKPSSVINARARGKQ